MQTVLFYVLQQRSAGPMDDAFGRAGGSGRKHNVERMIERQLRKLRHCRGAEFRVSDNVSAAWKRFSPAEVGDQHRCEQARQTLADFL